jgi:predicted aminopeptidase
MPGQRSLLNDPPMPELLKARLVLSQRIRSFATDHLKLPDTRATAAMRGPAAPSRGLEQTWWPRRVVPTLNTWCFGHGCAPAALEADAPQEAAQLRAQEATYGVPAYSTLGWLNSRWRPTAQYVHLLTPTANWRDSCFMNWRIRSYASGDTVFNELATAG